MYILCGLCTCMRRPNRTIITSMCSAGSTLFTHAALHVYARAELETRLDVGGKISDVCDRTLQTW